MTQQEKLQESNSRFLRTLLDAKLMTKPKSPTKRIILPMPDYLLKEIDDFTPPGQSRAEWIRDAIRIKLNRMQLIHMDEEKRIEYLKNLNSPAPQ